MARWHSLWMTPAQPADVEREVNIERVVTIARHQPLSAAAHSLASLTLAATYLTYAPVLIAVCAVAIQILAFLQFHAWLRHRHKARPTGASDATMNRIFAWSVCWGLLWGG